MAERVRRTDPTVHRSELRPIADAHRRSFWLSLFAAALALAACTSPDRLHGSATVTDRTVAGGALAADDDRQRCIEDALRREADTTPALGSVLRGTPIAADASEHDELVDAIAAAMRRCWDIDEMVDMAMATAARQTDIDAPTAACFRDRLGSGWFAERAADAMVHGGQADDTYEGVQLAAMMRCSTDLADKLERAGLPAAFVHCSVAAQEELAAQIEQTPARWRELTSEEANTARSLSCQREMPPISPGGSTTFAASAEAFVPAMVEELRSATGDALEPAVASCLTDAIVGGLGDEQLRLADPTAAELVAYMRGVYRPTELGLGVDAGPAEQLADAAVECAGTQLAFVLILTPGDVLDALGRPNDNPDLGAIVGCTLDRLDEAVLRTFFSVQLVDGPSARTTTAGERLVDHTFETIAECADALGIPHGTPAN